MRIVAVRVVGGRLDERWQAPDQEGPDPLSDARAAAAWVGDRLSQGSSENGAERRRVRFVCLDADGAACSWLTAPSGDLRVVAAAMMHEGGTDGEPSGGGGAFGGWTPGEASMQALAVVPARTKRATGDAGHRMAALAMPDVSARLFLDALDERGVSAGGVVSIWHALALAWDPGGPATSPSGLREDRVVATDCPVSAIVAIDPEGRLVWSWARAGELLAGGTIRLTASAPPDDATAGVRVTEHDVARLTTDWLAWASQLGVAPSRIICLGPESGTEGNALTPAQIGEALGRSWPGAAVDMAVHDDPIGATLHRLSESGAPTERAAEDPRAGLLPLSRRPSRAHRAMLHAASLALLLGAVGLAGLAWRAWSAAGHIRARAATLADERRSAIAAAIPRAATDAFPEKLLDEELTRLRAARDAGNELDAAKPILQELDVISAVLTDETKPENISLISSSAQITVLVPNLQTGSELLDALASIADSHCDWKAADHGPSGEKIRFYCNGAWRTPGKARP